MVHFVGFLYGPTGGEYQNFSSDASGEGGPMLPYSEPGYWTPDRPTFMIVGSKLFNITMPISGQTKQHFHYQSSLSVMTVIIG